MKNLNIYEGSPPQGLSEARRGKEVYPLLAAIIRRGGAPPGAAAFIAIRGMGALTSIITNEQKTIFRSKSLQN